MSRISSNAIIRLPHRHGRARLGVCRTPAGRESDLNVPLNPLGINGSPYGEVFAMAMQGPIDTYFHGAMGGGSPPPRDDGSCESCEVQVNTKHAAKSSAR